MNQVPYTCRLVLQNPHAMCYVNAGILALLHVCVRANLDVPEMQPIIKVATLASQRQQALSLTRMHHFRSLTLSLEVWAGPTRYRRAPVPALSDGACPRCKLGPSCD